MVIFIVDMERNMDKEIYGNKRYVKSEFYVKG